MGTCTYSLDRDPYTCPACTHREDSRLPAVDSVCRLRFHSRSCKSNDSRSQGLRRYRSGTCRSCSAELQSPCRTSTHPTSRQHLYLLRVTRRWKCPRQMRARSEWATPIQKLQPDSRSSRSRTHQQLAPSPAQSETGRARSRSGSRCTARLRDSPRRCHTTNPRASATACSSRGRGFPQSASARYPFAIEKASDFRVPATSAPSLTSQSQRFNQGRTVGAPRLPSTAAAAESALVDFAESAASHMLERSLLRQRRDSRSCTPRVACAMSHSHTTRAELAPGPDYRGARAELQRLAGVA